MWVFFYVYVLNVLDMQYLYKNESLMAHLQSNNRGQHSQNPHD